MRDLAIQIISDYLSSLEECLDDHPFAFMQSFAFLPLTVQFQYVCYLQIQNGLNVIIYVYCEIFHWSTTPHYQLSHSLLLIQTFDC